MWHVIKDNKVDVFAKVRLLDIFYLDEKNKNYQTIFNKISRKHVDYLICDTITAKPIVAIELDDSSHLKEHRIERDIFVNGIFDTAGLSLVRVPINERYNVEYLHSLIEEHIQ